jgi:uncharacterized protein YbbC (DUF1343 family)
MENSMKSHSNKTTIRNSNNPPVLTGLDVLEEMKFRQIRGSKVGLVVNPASVNRRLEHAADIFTRAEGLKMVSLFGPQHGITGTTQDNMIEWQGALDKRLGLPAHSLYGSHRKPTGEMLEGIDTLVLDLPDVGARYYTFNWTAKLCLEACAEKGIKMVVLDRPNPINGIQTEGPLLHCSYRSFVGLFEIPIRHGMTTGELLLMMNGEEKIGCNLEVIKARGWERKMWFDETGLPWVIPSPNMPTLDTAIVYPGMCLLEATNISEGRGTTRPFEICGAPYVNAHEMVNAMNEYKLPGVFFRPLQFEPTFQKHSGKTCGGFQIHVTDRESFRPMQTTVALLFSVKKLYPGYFEWKNPPYEYEYEKLPIDILWGDTSIREAVDGGGHYDEILEKMKRGDEDFKHLREKYLVY